MNQHSHWEKVCTTNLSEKLGWYKPHLQTSFTWIVELGLRVDRPEAPLFEPGRG